MSSGERTQEQITVLVHGTFANPDYAVVGSDDAPREGEPQRWWRLTGRGEDGTTADRLQKALADLDPSLAATVWRPGSDPRDGDLSYRGLGEWSGLNTHKARVRAAKELSGSLGALADRRGCDRENPLLVNFVAHSHGGNVVLESLRRLSDNVRPRQVCMLGTPLTWRFPDARVFYLLYLFFLLAAMLLGGWEGAVESAKEPPYPLTGVSLYAFAVFVYLLMLPLVLWLGVAAINLARWVSSLFPGRPAYGPRPKGLEEKLEGRPAVLFISPEDEADLMLQLGAAPLDAYRAMVVGRPGAAGAHSWIGRFVRFLLRLIERAYVRPLSYVVVIPLVEILLERFGLGFPLRTVLFFNFEMVTWTGAKTYRETQIVTHHVAAHALRPRILSLALTEGPMPAATPAARSPGKRSDAERIIALRRTLVGTLASLRQQVNLRHSGYYESPEIIEEVARALAAPAGAIPSAAVPR